MLWCGVHPIQVTVDSGYGLQPVTININLYTHIYAHYTRYIRENIQPFRRVEKERRTYTNNIH